MERALQQFLQAYKITPNPNTPMGRSLAGTMFARKVKSVFDKLIPRQAKFKKTVSPHKKHFYPGDKISFQGLQKQHYIMGMNQLRKCRLNESEESPQNTCEEPIISILTRLKSLRKNDAREEKEILRNHLT